MPPELIDILKSIWALPGIRVIGAHILLNTVLALAATARTGEFKLFKLADFLYKKMLPLCLTYFAAQSLADAAGLTGLGGVTWAAIQAALLGDTLNSLADLGLKLPDTVLQVSTKTEPILRTLRTIRMESRNKPRYPETGIDQGWGAPPSSKISGDG